MQLWSAPIKTAEALGGVLRDARIRNGLSQHEMSERLGVGHREIVAIEKGDATKAVKRLFDFMRETGVEMYVGVRGDG